MIEPASKYAPGTANYNAVANSQGYAAARAQWQAAIIAEQTQTPMDASFWDVLGTNLYNDPLGAPIDQAGTVAGNTAQDLGNATKTALGKALSNWGVWILAAVILIGVTLYFFGPAIARRTRRA